MQAVVQISRICLNLLKERLLRKEERAGKSVSLVFTALKYQVEALAPKVKENVPKFMCHIKENSALWFFSLRHRNKEYITVINKCPLTKCIDFSVHSIKTCNDNTVFLQSKLQIRYWRDIQFPMFPHRQRYRLNLFLHSFLGCIVKFVVAPDKSPIPQRLLRI